MPVIWEGLSMFPQPQSPFVCVSWGISFQERQGFRAPGALA